MNNPASRRGCQPGQRRVELKLDAAATGEIDQAVPHVPGAIGHRKQLARLLFKLERNADFLFEELALCDERP
jgi:hypothetical protein